MLICPRSPRHPTPGFVSSREAGSPRPRGSAERGEYHGCAGQDVSRGGPWLGPPARRRRPRPSPGTAPQQRHGPATVGRALSSLPRIPAMKRNPGDPRRRGGRARRADLVGLDAATAPPRVRGRRRGRRGGPPHPNRPRPAPRPRSPARRCRPRGRGGCSGGDQPSEALAFEARPACSSTSVVLLWQRAVRPREYPAALTERRLGKPECQG